MDAGLSGFELALRTRVVFGAGVVERLGALAAELGARAAFLVTDPGIVAAGHVARAESSLAEAGIEVRRFDAVRENPTTVDVGRCLSSLGDWPADLLVGMGGGSSIDVAKGCAFLLAGGGQMEDYWGRGKARGTLLPLIAVPTTAGTGSETQSFALIGQEVGHQKMACGDPQAAPRISLLDPTLTLTQPPSVTACTGLDALGHAVEAAVTRARTPASALFSCEAFRLVLHALPKVLADATDLGARGDMLLGAAYAGVAIEHSMLGAAHALANPLTAHFDVPHGQAVGMMLPRVVEYNAQDSETAGLYAALAHAAGLAGTDGLVVRLRELLALAGFPPSLAACGVDADAVPALADEAARQWTAGFNPRAIGPAELAAVLHETFSSF